MSDKRFEYDGVVPEPERQLLVLALGALRREINQGVDSMAQATEVARLAHGQDRQRALEMINPVALTDEVDNLITSLARKFGGRA